MQQTTLEIRPTRVPSWSSLLFRGIASILFGIIAFAWPGITVKALVLLFGAYAFVDGVSALALAVQRGGRRHRWLLVADGLFGIGAGVVALFWPGITLLALVFVIGIRFVVSGVVEIATAFRLKDELEVPLLYGLAGVASVVLGILAFIVPGITALVLVTMLAAYALAFGIMMLVVAVRMRRPLHRAPGRPLPA